MEPKSPSHEYDFILKDTPQQKASLIPGGSKFLLFLIAAAVLLIIIIIIGVSVNKGGGKTTGLVDVMARAQEIDRVTKAQSSNFKDPGTLDLASTVDATVTSDQSQLNKYLTSHNKKVNKKKLETYKNTKTDSQMTSALQANNLDATYINYIRTSLTEYAQAIKNSYDGSTNAQAKSILQNAYNSTSTLLDAAPLKS